MDHINIEWINYIKLYTEISKHIKLSTILVEKQITTLINCSQPITRATNEPTNQLILLAQLFLEH
jgi:hypothetical protein